MKSRKFLRGFDAYEWETPTEEIAKKTGLKAAEVFRMDTNTSPLIPKAELQRLSKKVSGMEVNQYPDTSYAELRRRLSVYCKKGEDRFVVTNGADEGLDLVSKTFLDEGDDVIIPAPTYSMFRIITEIMGGKAIVVRRRKDFSVDVDEVLRSAGKRTKLIFLCNPNNPTGNLTPKKDIESLLAKTDAVVVIDEAYFEYCGQTAADLTNRYDNLVVIRTFSKAFSMAGVRVGYLLASEPTTKLLNKVRPPNSLTVISLELAQEALGDTTEMKRNVASTVRERERCFKGLGALPGIEPYPSNGNFVLFRIDGTDANKVHARLLGKGFVLRNLSGMPGVENCLRVTIGTPDTNEAFLEALRDALL